TMKEQLAQETKARQTGELGRDEAENAVKRVSNKLKDEIQAKEVAQAALFPKGVQAWFLGANLAGEAMAGEKPDDWKANTAVEAKGLDVNAVATDAAKERAPQNSGAVPAKAESMGTGETASNAGEINLAGQGRLVKASEPGQPVAVVQ
ncbi:MAG: hypothetical protein HY765_03475, partial [Rhodomicrobium sp.]|nr:hypothetical protein [Rhodomicrobium sp.]